MNFGLSIRGKSLLEVVALMGHDFRLKILDLETKRQLAAFVYDLYKYKMIVEEQRVFAYRCGLSWGGKIIASIREIDAELGYGEEYTQVIMQRVVDKLVSDANLAVVVARVAAEPNPEDGEDRTLLVNDEECYYP
ncbi:MAG: hypothetical protein HY974_02785 [Candidatus Kerfeldbacteria bacterium]|nr:hypothetical protein [Candidatus Kerfeldbacteria bacterium]